MFPFVDLGFVKIPTYGICMVIGLFLAAGLMLWRTRKTDVCCEDLIAIQAVCLASCLFGAKFLYIVVTYSPDEIMGYIMKGDFSFIGRSGLVFYGGLIFGIIGTLLMAKALKVDLLGIEKHIVPFIPLGHAIGRVGCFLAGCCYGMEYSGPLAVYYPKAPLKFMDFPEFGVGYFPVQLLESLLDLVIFGILLVYTKKERQRGNVLFAYIMMYAIMRFCTELFRGDAVRGIHFSVSTSQWISIVLIVLFFARLIYLNWKNRLKN